jgi:hypothetical protein
MCLSMFCGTHKVSPYLKLGFAVERNTHFVEDCALYVISRVITRSLNDEICSPLLPPELVSTNLCLAWAHTSHRTLPLLQRLIKAGCCAECQSLLAGWKQNRNFGAGYSKYTRHEYYSKIQCIGVELLHADWKTDRHALACRNSFPESA